MGLAMIPRLVAAHMSGSALALRSTSHTTTRTITTRSIRHISGATNININSNSSLSVDSVTVASATELNVPLYERPAKFSATSEELHKWKAWAQHGAKRVGSSFLLADEGPDCEELLREIEWLLEDTVDGYDRRKLPPEVPVRMRVRVEELYGLWKQRLQLRRPFQYLVGCCHWRHLVIAVQEGVLIPRPETEQLIDLVRDAIRKHEALANGVWADLGTGSGALALALAGLLPHHHHSQVFAVDVSPVAVAVARYNVRRCNLQAKVEVREGSWFQPLHEFNGKLAGVLSNPPYIPASEISGLQAEVGKHEPILALNGGKDGIDDLLHLSRQCISALRPGGFLAFETNGGKQAEAVAEFLLHCSDNNFKDVEVVTDYRRIPRFVTAFHC